MPLLRLCAEAAYAEVVAGMEYDLAIRLGIDPDASSSIAR